MSISYDLARNAWMRFHSLNQKRVNNKVLSLPPQEEETPPRLPDPVDVFDPVDDPFSAREDHFDSRFDEEAVSDAFDDEDDFNEDDYDFPETVL